MDIATHPYNNSVVIFIHGVMSNQYVAWKPVIDLLQNIHQNTNGSAIRSFDFCTFQYDSGLFSQPSIIGYLNRLEALIGRPRYDSVVLIGHSQGGILAKLYIIDQLERGNGQTMKIDEVITLDTPHKGPQPWIYPAVLLGGLLKPIPFVRNLSLFRQTAEMSYWSANLKKLREKWNSTIIAEHPCPPTPFRRHIRTLCISGPPLRGLRFKLVVPRRSAEGFPIDKPVRSAPAWSVGHGVADMLDQHRPQIEQELSRLQELELLILKQEFLTLPISTIKDSLMQIDPTLASDCSVVCWSDRLKHFEKKPLRSLSRDEAIRKFIELRLNNP